MLRTPGAELAALPLIRRFAVLGATSAGIIGCIAGLIVGLHTYAPTGLFAVVELGLPATIAGAMVGLTIGSMTFAIRRIMRWNTP